MYFERANSEKYWQVSHFSPVELYWHFFLFRNWVSCAWSSLVLTRQSFVSIGQCCTLFLSNCPVPGDEVKLQRLTFLVPIRSKIYDTLDMPSNTKPRFDSICSAFGWGTTLSSGLSHWWRRLKLQNTYCTSENGLVGIELKVSAFYLQL